MPVPPNSTLLLQITDGASYVIARVTRKGYAAWVP
jgi:hypothetical protein